jgi:hypothetical protein
LKSRSIIPPPLFPPRAGFLGLDAFLALAFFAGVVLATGFRLGGIEGWYQESR